MGPIRGCRGRGEYTMRFLSSSPVDGEFKEEQTSTLIVHVAALEGLLRGGGGGRGPAPKSPSYTREVGIQLGVQSVQVRVRSGARAGISLLGGGWPIGFPNWVCPSPRLSQGGAEGPPQAVENGKCLGKNSCQTYHQQQGRQEAAKNGSMRHEKAGNGDAGAMKGWSKGQKLCTETRLLAGSRHSIHSCALKGWVVPWLNPPGYGKLDFQHLMKAGQLELLLDAQSLICTQFGKGRAY
eukprot:1144451-Pelagomonas_calceolata.AAC.6